MTLNWVVQYSVPATWSVSYLPKPGYECLCQRDGPEFTLINTLVPKVSIFFSWSWQTESECLQKGAVDFSHGAFLGSRLNKIDIKCQTWKTAHLLDFLQRCLAPLSAATCQYHPGPPSSQVNGCLLSNASVAACKSQIKIIVFALKLHKKTSSIENTRSTAAQTFDMYKSYTIYELE